MFEKEYSWQQDELGGYSYLPVKRKIKIPPWLTAAVVSVAASVICLAVYTEAVLPNMRPTTVISYAGGTESDGGAATEPESDGGFVGMGEKLAGSVVSVSSQGQSGGFFSQMLSYGGGSGIVISADGYILTNNSIVSRQGGAITVTLSDDSSYDAQIVGTDARTDCAILKIDKTGLMPVQFADSDTALSGMRVAALGRIMNDQLGATLTQGTICGISKGVTLQNGQSINLMQTDAAAANSAGSALLDGEGRLIGMVTAMISSEADNIALAIPSNDIMQVVESVINTGVAPSGLTIGIMGEDADYGVIVDSVSEDSPAQKAGVKKGDLIMKVDGTTVKSVKEINKIRDTHSHGDVIVFTVYRDGETMDIEITLG